MKNLKAVNLVLTVMVLAMSVTVQGCLDMQKKVGNPEPTLIGTWKLKDAQGGSGTVLTIKADETYTVDLGGEGTSQIRGTYELFENRIRLTDVSADGEMNCKHSGFYFYRIDGRTLNFDIFVDECTDREEILKTGWRWVPSLS